MNAVEALAEVLRELSFQQPGIDDQTSSLWTYRAALLAEAVRSWPAEQVAELIGAAEATREWGIQWDNHDVDFPHMSMSAADHIAQDTRLDESDTYRIVRRSVLRTPWTQEPT